MLTKKGGSRRGLGISLLTIITLVTSPVLADAPASQPTTQIVDAPLPTGALRRFGDTRFAATSPEDFRSADFSPDGVHLLTAGAQARIWDIQSGSVVRVLEDQGETCDHAVYLTADRIVVAWHADNKIELVIHDTATGKRLRSLDCDETTPLVDLAASPDGSRVAVAGHRLSLLDAQSGARIATMNQIQRATASTEALPTPRVQFTSDGKTLLAISTDMQAAFYDAQTGQMKDTPAFSTAHGACLSGDGRSIVVLNQNNDLYDVASREQIPVPAAVLKRTQPFDPESRSFFTCLRLSAQGILATACSAPEPKIFLWDTTARPIQPPRWIATRDIMPMQLDFSRDGHTLAVLSQGSRPELLDVATGNPIAGSQTHTGVITSIDLSPDGKTLLTGDCRSTLALWDFNTGKRLAMRDGASRYGIAPTRGTLRFNPDGKTILISAETGAYEIADATNLNFIRRMARPKAATRPVGTTPLIKGYAVGSHDGRLVAEWFPGQIAHVYDVEKSTHLQTFPARLAHPTLMEFSPDDKTLAIPIDGGIDMYLVATGGLIAKHCDGLHNTLACRPRFSPDGNKVALVDATSLTVWDTSPNTDANSGRPIFTLARHGTGVGEFDDLGTFIAVADLDPLLTNAMQKQSHGGVSLYETDTGQLVATLPNTPADVQAIRWIPHHPWLVTAGSDASATLWDLTDLFADPTLHALPVASLWSQLGGDNAAAAYRAGAELVRRNLLVDQCRSLPASAFGGGSAQVIQKWIAQLSSPDAKEKESAHKHLEAAGSAARSAVRAALASHPGGETEDRLTDIARIIHSDEADDASAVSNPDLTRARRALRWLKWSSDPASQAEAARLTGTANSMATSKPAISQP
jgi:WD40 repeat protein